jgi:hypothetical protein
LEDDLRRPDRIIDELDTGLNPEAERATPKAKRQSKTKERTPQQTSITDAIFRWFNPCERGIGTALLEPSSSYGR